MSRIKTPAKAINKIDAEIQEILLEAENLIAEKYEKIDYAQKLTNSDSFLRFFDRSMKQITKKK